MPTSQDDLDKLAVENQKLRDQIADEKAKKAANEAELANDVYADTARKEQERLKAELAELKATSSVKAVKEGASAVLDPEGHVAKIEAARSLGVEEGDFTGLQNPIEGSSPRSRAKGGNS